MLMASIRMPDQIPNLAAAMPRQPVPLMTNNAPASGCSCNCLSVSPKRAEVTYRSSKPSPPNVQEVTRDTGNEIRPMHAPLAGSQRDNCHPSQCAIHNIPSSSMVIPSGYPSSSEKVMTVRLPEINPLAE
jgi:hypothetical protein